MIRTVSGVVEEGYGAVADEFQRIANERGESGSAFTVEVRGQVVVDIWSGYAETEGRQLWGRGTIAPMFSGSKGLVAAAMLRLVESGKLDLDRAVGHYWPAYATHGKESTTVRQVVSHQAGIPGVRAPLTPDDLLDDIAMGARVAAEPAILAPGSAIVYHALTFGWLCGELVRRVDGRSIGRFIAEEIADPLGLRTWIGLPMSEEPNVATLVFDPPAAAASLGVRADDTLARVLIANPVLPQSWWNSRPFRAAEIPGANGITDAASMARFYSALVSGRRVLDPATLDVGTAPLAAGIDALTGAYSVFGVGFQLDNGTDYFGGVVDAFGHGGVGGGRHGAWRSSGVGFSYLPGYIRDGADDDRAPRLLTALAGVVGA